MIYKERIQTLLESLNTKLRTIQAISQGTLNIPTSEVDSVIKQSINITEKLESLINAER